MSAYDLMQYGVIAIVVALSAWTAFGRLAPKLRARLLARLGHRAPPATTASGCDSGCSSCGGCGTRSTPVEQTIRFEPPKR